MAKVLDGLTEVLHIGGYLLSCASRNRIETIYVRFDRRVAVLWDEDFGARNWEREYLLGSTKHVRRIDARRIDQGHTKH